MAFDPSIVDAHKVARRLVTLINNAHLHVSTAKTQIAGDTYDKVIQLPAMVRQFVDETDQMIADGFTAAVLAPYIADIYNIDASGVSADLATLRSSLVSLRTAIESNSTVFQFTFNAQGFVSFDQPLTAPQKSALESELDAVLAVYV